MEKSETPTRITHSDGKIGKQDNIASLAAAIAADHGVVFVGAGASASSLIPMWGALLEKCLKFAKDHRYSVEQARIRFEQGDYLVAAELLERALGRDGLHNFVKEVVQPKPPLKPLKPSSIHSAIARLPFRIAITTNFDDLLEQVYRRKHGTSPLTWKSAEEVFKRTRDGQFFILKSHGDADNRDSLVLTRSHFRDQMSNDRDLYNEALRSILLGNQILFVGHSLRDLDLLHMMDDLLARFGERCFGPHFAILNEAEVDQPLRAYLKASFNIELLTFPDHQFRDLPKTESRTRSVTELLTEISGEVARKRSARVFNFSVDEKYYLTKTCENILEQACETLGASEGAICLTLQRRVRPLRYVAISSREPNKTSGDDVNYEGDLGSLFLHRNMDEDWLNVGDLRADRLHLDHSPKAVRSRLACPIYCDGYREGVISVESEIPSAFTYQHVEALTQVARWVGIALFETRQRILTADLLPYANDMGKLLELLWCSRVLKDVDLRVILYKLRYVEGYMEAVSLETTASGKPFKHHFGGRSLASLVLEKRTPIEVKDAIEELKQEEPRLDVRGVEEFGISGPVVGVPIRAKGYTAGVLVAWSGKQHPPSWHYVPEKLLRMANIIASDPQIWDPTSKLSAKIFLTELNKRLEPIDKGKPWGKELAAKHGSEIFEVLSKALVELVGISRTRIFQRARIPGYPSASLFICVSSLNRGRDGELEFNKFAGTAVMGDDLYCQYTLRRFAHDPYARPQHRTMFGNIEDHNSAMLEKDPNGIWMVGPIVETTHDGRRRLLGYLSADNHEWSQAKRRMVDRELPSELLEFQRHAIDIVTDRLTVVGTVSVSNGPPYTVKIEKGRAPVPVKTKDGALQMAKAARAHKAAAGK